jgi:hypothetical protein
MVIATALHRLSVDAEYRKRLGDAGKEYAKGHDWMLIASRFMGYYSEILGSGSPFPYTISA